MSYEYDNPRNPLKGLTSSLSHDDALKFDDEYVIARNEGWLWKYIGPTPTHITPSLMDYALIAVVEYDLIVFRHNQREIELTDEDDRDLRRIANRAGYTVTIAHHKITFERGL